MSNIWFLKINSSYEFLVKYEVNEQAYIFYEAAEAPQPLVIISEEFKAYTRQFYSTLFLNTVY